MVKSCIAETSLRPCTTAPREGLERENTPTRRKRALAKETPFAQQRTALHKLKDISAVTNRSQWIGSRS
jgi:hypothetical protein